MGHAIQKRNLGGAPFGRIQNRGQYSVEMFTNLGIREPQDTITHTPERNDLGQRPWARSWVSPSISITSRRLRQTKSQIKPLIVIWRENLRPSST